MTNLPMFYRSNSTRHTRVGGKPIDEVMFRAGVVYDVIRWRPNGWAELRVEGGSFTLADPEYLDLHFTPVTKDLFDKQKEDRGWNQTAKSAQS